MTNTVIDTEDGTYNRLDLVRGNIDSLELELKNTSDELFLDYRDLRGLDEDQLRTILKSDKTDKNKRIAIEDYLYTKGQYDNFTQMYDDAKE